MPHVHTSLNVASVSKASQSTEELVLSLVNRLEPRLRKAFLESIAEMKGVVDLEAVARDLVNGNVDAALDKLVRPNQRFSGAVNTGYASSGTATAGLLSDAIGVTVSFDLSNTRATSRMQAANLRLVQQFTEEQRQMTRNALTTAVRDGVNPRRAAQDLRDNLGLTDSQSSAVNRYRELLRTLDPAALDRKLRDARFDRSFMNAVREGRGLTDDQIDKMVDRYRQRYLKYRAEVIARTEAMRAVHEGTEDLFAQAIQEGRIDPANVVREWHTARDSRVRDTHRTMNGQKRAYGQPFMTGAGVPIMYPGDPSAGASEVIQCRCSVSTRITKL